ATQMGQRLRGRGALKASLDPWGRGSEVEGGVGLDSFTPSLWNLRRNPATAERDSGFYAIRHSNHSRVRPRLSRKALSSCVSFTLEEASFSCVVKVSQRFEARGLAGRAADRSGCSPLCIGSGYNSNPVRASYLGAGRGP